MYSSRSNLIIGFHGCDEKVALELVNNPKKVKISEKPFDWLGHGFYIWENNYDRALEWAKDKEKKGKIQKASVVGVVITLDYCLDLIDSEFINTLSVYYKLMEREFTDLGNELPKNKDVKEDNHKDLIRELDCAVIEYLHTKVREKVQVIREISNSLIQQEAFLQKVGLHFRELVFKRKAIFRYVSEI